MSSQSRVVLLIYNLESFLAFRALSSLPRVILFIYDPESFLVTTQSHFHPLSVQSHYFISWLFRIIGLQISYQHLEPPFSFRGVQNHFFQFQAFRVISFISFKRSESLISSSFRSLEPLSLHSLAFRAIIICLQFGVQTHVFSTDVQSHLFQFRRSEPSFPIQAFKPTSVWHLEPSSSSIFFIQSRCAYSFKRLKSPSFLFLAFKVIFPQPYHSESQLLAFIFTNIAHLTFTILHSSSFFSPHYLVLIACSSCFSRLPFPLHMTQSFEFTTHISIMLLGALHLAFSCSSYKAVPFGHILSCTPMWFDRYSFLTLIFKSLSKTSQREFGSITQLQRHYESYHSLRILESILFFVGLSKFVFYLCTFRSLSFSLVEFTSFHSLFTLSFHSSVHIPYTCELYRRGAYLQTPLVSYPRRVGSGFLKWETVFEGAKLHGTCGKDYQLAMVVVEGGDVLVEPRAVESVEAWWGKKRASEKGVREGFQQRTLWEREIEERKNKTVRRS